MKTATRSTLRALSVLSLIVFLSISALAQTIIHERIEINPLPKTLKTLSESGSSQRPIHLEFSSSTDHTIRIAQDNGEIVYGHGTVEEDIYSAGDIYFQVSCFEYAENVSVSYHISATIDNIVLANLDGEWVLGPSNGFDGGSINLNPYHPLYFSGLRDMCDGTTSSIWLYPLPANGYDCTNYYLPVNDQVSLSIIRGEALGGFSQDGESIDGSSVSLFVPEVKNLFYKVKNDLPPEFISDTVKIQLKAGHIQDTISFKVSVCSRGTSFGLWSQRTKILVRTSNTVGVDPIMDSTSHIIWDKKTDPVTLTIVSGNEYGGFALNGEKQQGPSLTLVGSQLDGLSFIASDSLPLGITERPVTIQAQSKGIVKTVSFIVQSTAKLKLTLNIDPASIAYGKYTYASAQTVNIEDGTPETPPDDVTYTFALTGGSQFARFYISDGGGPTGSIVPGIIKADSAHQALSKRLSNIQLKKPTLSVKQAPLTPVLKKTVATATTGIVDDGGPDILQGVSQSDGWRAVLPEASDQEPVNPEGEIVQVTVSASDANITPASAEFRVMPNSIKVTANPSIIKQGAQSTIAVQKKNASGVYEDLPADAYVTFEIRKGFPAGQLSSSDGSQGGYIYGQFQSAVFIAKIDTSLPDNNPVRVFAYTDDGSGLGKLTITKEQGCIRAQFANTPLSVGDTTALVFKYAETGQPVPVDKLLDVSISVTDGTRGWILPSSGGANPVWNGIMQPIKYIAPSDIAGDSLAVYITAVESQSGGSGSVITNKEQSTNSTVSTKVIASSASNQNTNTGLINGPHGTYIHPQYFSPATIKALQANTCPLENKAGTVDNDCGHPPCGDPPTVNPLPPRDVSNLIPTPQEACQVPNELGWTTAVIDRPIFPNNTLNNLFSVQVCANRHSKQWEFRLTTIGFLYQTGICESHLIGKTDIGDGTGPNINAGNYCKVLEWLTTINPNTNQPNPGNYYSSNILRRHESFHLKNLENQFREKCLPIFLNNVNTLCVPITDCSETAHNVIDQNKSKLEKDFHKSMKAFMESINEEYENNDETKVRKSTLAFFIGLKEIIKKRADDEKWPKCPKN